MEDLTGRQFGPYQVVAPLGEGGMAAVYKAYQPAMERYVAMKVLPRHFADDTQFVARFHREAKLLAQLQHPHILPVFDYGQAEGYTYIVMPFVQTGTLTDALQGPPLPLPRIRQVISQVGEALDYAHKRGFVHRDVKPSNILMDESGNSLLSDFGLARMVEATANLTTSGTIIGTPAYMSPEQGSGQKVDGRSDIYSLGVILYQMATGRVPYQAETPVAVIFQHMNDPLPPPRRINPDLPEALESVILKALAKRPEDRYQSAKMMAVAIRQALPDEAPALPVTPPKATLHSTLVSTTRSGAVRAQPAKRSSTVAVLGLAGAAGVILVGAMVVLVVRALGQSPRAVALLFAGPTAVTASPARPTTTAAPRTEAVAVEASPPPLMPQSAEPSGRIAFVCQLSRSEENDQICVMDADGSAFRRLTTDDGGDYNYPSWASDGESIVLAGRDGRDFEIMEALLGGARMVILASGSASLLAPQLSPDGSSIVYTESTGDSMSIWVMARDGSGKRQVFGPPDGNGWDPVWSPDGSEILFASGPVNRPQLFVIRADGRDLRQITDIDGLRGRSDWSPDGRTIATYVGDSWQREILLMDRDGSNMRQLTEGGNNLAPSFSPDGNWIAFTSYRDNLGDPNGCEIYIMTIEGKDLRRLTNNDYCDWQPSWGP